MKTATIEAIQEMAKKLKDIKRPSGYILLPMGEEIKIFEVDAKTLEILLKLDLKQAENIINPRINK